jgi:hypothetical protein
LNLPMIFYRRRVGLCDPWDRLLSPLWLRCSIPGASSFKAAA